MVRVCWHCSSTFDCELSNNNYGRYLNSKWIAIDTHSHHTVHNRGCFERMRCWGVAIVRCQCWTMLRSTNRNGSFRGSSFFVLPRWFSFSSRPWRNTVVLYCLAIYRRCLINYTPTAYFSFLADSEHWPWYRTRRKRSRPSNVRIRDKEALSDLHRTSSI